MAIGASNFKRLLALTNIYLPLFTQRNVWGHCAHHMCNYSVAEKSDCIEIKQADLCTILYFKSRGQYKDDIISYDLMKVAIWPLCPQNQLALVVF